MEGDNIKIKYTYEQSHKKINGVLYKLCNRHLVTFPNEDAWFPCTEEHFYKNNKSPDGLFPYCKKCNIKKSLKYKYEHYDKFLIGQKKNNARPEVKEQTRMLSKLKRERGDERKWRQENKDKIKIYNENRKHKNHDITKEEWEYCKKYFDYSCAYCGIGENEAKEHQGQYLHKEHATCNGASDLSNCVPSCKSCNSKKWEYDFNKWYNENNPVYDEDRLNKIHKWLNEDYKIYIVNN